MYCVRLQSVDRIQCRRSHVSFVSCLFLNNVSVGSPVSCSGYGYHTSKPNVKICGAKMSNSCVMASTPNNFIAAGWPKHLGCFVCLFGNVVLGKSKVPAFVEDDPKVFVGVSSLYPHI